MSNTKGSMLISNADAVGTELVNQLGGTGYKPTEWSDAINLLGIKSADIPTALAGITPGSYSGSERGSIKYTTGNAVGAMLNKKYNTNRGFKPVEWEDAISKLTPLPENTVSGDICNIQDGADEVPIKSWEVEIAPTLTGKSAIECTQTGKNLLDTAISETKTHNSVSITCDGNGKYTATGTATGGSANITFTLKTPCTIKSGMYLHLMNSGASGSVSITLQKQDNTTIYAPALSPANRIADLSSYAGQTIYSIRFYIANGASFEMSLTPMVCFSSTATTYEPYQTPTQYTANLGRTIYGGEVDIVNGVGQDYALWVNLSDIAWTEDTNRAGVFYGSVAGRKTATADDPSDVLDCTCYNVNNVNVTTGIDNYISGARSYGGNIIFFRDSSFHGYTRAQVQEALQGEKVCVVSANPIDFTFTGQEIPTRLGYNAFWSDEGDTEVTYRASGTITPVPVVPTLISKTITENGTYDAEDDDADGYSEVTVNVSGVPSGDHDDPLGIMTDYTRYNVSNLYSAYYIGNGELKKEVVFQMASATGYEGFCISLDGLGLTNGTQYTLSFVLDVPAGTSFSGLYPWGAKYSSTRIPSSGSANSNTFNITPSVDFAQQTGTQNVSITFTASSTNYLVVLLSRLAGSITSWFKMRDIQIEEVTP